MVYGLSAITVFGRPIKERDARNPNMSEASVLVEGHEPIQPPANVLAWDIDPHSETVLLNLEEYFAELRAKGPFVYIPLRSWR